MTATPAFDAGDAAAHTANLLLARTIDIPLDIGNDPGHTWTLDADGPMFDLCGAAGFTAVRLMLDWSAVAGSRPPFTIAPTALDRVDRALGLAAAHGLAVVIQAVLDEGILADPPAHRDRLLAITRQVAEHFADRPASVLIEPAAEPRGALDAVWNEYLADLVTTVRQSNPDRTLIFGPGAYNNIRALGALRLPGDDRNIITTIHQYWPITFTMQGETWLGTDTPFGDPKSWLGTTWDGTEQQRGELAAGFAGLAKWSQAAGRPIFVGEFGTSNNADMASRVRWTEFNRRLAEENGFTWGVWSFGPSFALYDAGSGSWHPGLLAALGL
jgi:endoglucanase